MSNLHIPSWTSQDIANWIRGLDNVLERYIPNFQEHNVTGEQLLHMTIEQLQHMDIAKIGHQELMLEAIDLLCSVHNSHPKETLQSVALNLNCKSSNLANLLVQRMKSGDNTNDIMYCTSATILLLVSETISAAKTLISWLDRPPFSTSSEKDFHEYSKDVLTYALQMTQTVQQNTDLKEGLADIANIAKELASMADNLIKQSTDPNVIQPTMIKEVQIKKKRMDEELGLCIKTSTIDGIHYITGTKDKSAASVCKKVGPGDELLRVNEQTVVSWEHSKVVAALKSNPMEVYLTLRKRPCNLGSPGQVVRLGNSQYSTRFGMVQMRRDSFPSLRSPLLNEEFLMPASPSDIMMTKARSNSDPKPPSSSETHHDKHASDAEALIQAERIKRQRRGTMGEAQRKANKTQSTSEGRPRSLPINTEELEVEVALWEASPISGRQSFSPIAGSPQTASSSQASPSSESPPSSQQDGSTALPAHPTRANDPPAPPAGGSMPDLEISAPPTGDNKEAHPRDDDDHREVEGRGSGEQARANDGMSVESETQVKQEGPGSPSPVSPSSEVVPEVVPEVAQSVEATNTNNNVDASTDSLTPHLGEFIVNDKAMQKTTNSVKFVEMKRQSVADSESSTTSVVKLRPKKSKYKFKVARGVSCVDLGPGECEGWLHKKSEHKQTFKSNWSEMWFVLKDFVLYYYTSKKSIKAKGVLCLPGYTLSVEPESKRENSFKAVHKGTKPIYFAAKRHDDKEKWLHKLSLAAILYTDETRVRQSVIISSQTSLDVGAATPSVVGYHSESEDDDIDARSERSGSLSPSSSDIDWTAGAKTPPASRQPQRSHTSPDLLSPATDPGSPSPVHKLFMRKGKEAGGSSPRSPKIGKRIIETLRARRHSRGSIATGQSESEMLEEANAKRRNSTPFDGIYHSLPNTSTLPVITQPASPEPSAYDENPLNSSPTAQNGDSHAPGKASRTDALLDHYVSLRDGNVTVDGIERCAARNSKRFTVSDKTDLKRIHTVLDRDPKKNRKALQKRALLRTLKAKQAELDQLEAFLSAKTITSASIHSWRTTHEDLLEHVLIGPQPETSSDSDPDPTTQEETSSGKAGTVGGNQQANGEGCTETSGESSVDRRHRTTDDGRRDIEEQESSRTEQCQDKGAEGVPVVTSPGVKPPGLPAELLFPGRLSIGKNDLVTKF